jgi:hypothetical protein
MPEKRKPRVRLIHWKADEAREAAARLRAAGYTVQSAPVDGSTIKELRKSPPAAVVIDLSRLPSGGRDIGVALRISPATRAVPLVFVGGEAGKICPIRRLLPDAVFTTWPRIRGSLKKAIASPPATPVAHRSVFAAYSGRALPKKLGIKAGTTVALLGAPDRFDETLGKLPEGVTLRRQARGVPDLILWFTRSRADVERRIAQLGIKAGDGGLWVAWPKRTSGVETDLTQAMVRKIGLDRGLVDYKVCSIDEVWTGLRFTRRK